MANTISFLPDPELGAAFDRYCKEHALTRSQAGRVLLALALRGEQDADQVFRQRVAREGITAGISAVKKRLGDVLNGALSDLDGYGE